MRNGIFFFNMIEYRQYTMDERHRVSKYVLESKSYNQYIFVEWLHVILLGLMWIQLLEVNSMYASKGISIYMKNIMSKFIFLLTLNALTRILN